MVLISGASAFMQSSHSDDGISSYRAPLLPETLVAVHLCALCPTADVSVLLATFSRMTTMQMHLRYAPEYRPGLRGGI